MAIGPDAAKVQLGNPGAQDQQGMAATLADSSAGEPGTPSVEAAPAPELPDRQRSWDEASMVPSQEAQSQAEPKLVEALDSKPVEAFNWAELQDVSKRDSYCRHCRMPVESDPKTVVRKKGHQALQCRRCHNVVSLLYRRMDMKNLDDWKSLTPAQMANFYRHAGKCVCPMTGNLDFEKIRGCLIDEISEVERHVHETKMKGKYLPLTVWKSKGYDITAIEQAADWKESDMFLGGSYLYFCFGALSGTFLLTLPFCWAGFHIAEVWQGLCRPRASDFSCTHPRRSEVQGHASWEENLKTYLVLDCIFFWDGSVCLMWSWYFFLGLVCFGRSNPCQGKASKEGPADKAASEIEGDQAEDASDHSDWETVASSKSEHRRGGGGGAARSPKGKKSARGKAKAAKVSNEAKAEARKTNAPIVAKARKALRLLEPVLKDCKKVTRSPNCTDDVKGELDAAGKIVKEANKVKKDAPGYGSAGKTLPAFEHEADTCKELAKAIRDKAEGILQLDAVINKMGDEGLNKLAQRAQRRVNAEEVNWVLHHSFTQLCFVNIWASLIWYVV